jgi:protein involved in polysaccharide export with SLBB domain
MLRSAVALTLSALIFVLVLCAAGPGSHSGSFWSVTQASARASGYQLRPNDRLRIKVYNEPEISGEYQVDASGFISIPLTGRIRASGLTTDRLERVIVSRLTDGVIRDPKVSVEVATYAPLYILGEVKRPAELTYRPGLLVLDAIAAAGGYTYRANERKVFIRRAGSLVEEVHAMDAPIPVYPGDNIRVPERYF